MGGGGEVLWGGWQGAVLGRRPPHLSIMKIESK